MNSQKKKKRGSPLANYLNKTPSWELIERKVEIVRLRLADEVRTSRKERNLSTNALANMSNVSAGTISNIENARPVKFDSVVKVLDGLDMGIEFT